VATAAAFDVAAYRHSAERFLERIDREYYLHLAGHKPDLELEPIYGDHRELFEPSAVAALRKAADAATGDEERRLRYLLQFALDGTLGEATRAEAEEVARLEATLEVEMDGEAVPYRRVPVDQANEPDAERRAELDGARNALVAEHLTPLFETALERSHALCRELGWEGYAAAYEDLRGLDFAALAQVTRAFLDATGSAYERLVGAELERAGLPRLGELRRSDLPRFFRAPALDTGFPAERLVPAFAETMRGLGIELERQANVHLDTESRPTKTPRAFCSPVRVPGEVYLVVAPVGGREDYAALFHEGGHTEHYASVEPGLAFEFRHLGDNGVTESFAFLFDHLIEDPAWLEFALGVEDPEPVAAHSRAELLVYLRRYSAKLAYERELHGAAPDLGAMPDRYATLMSESTRVSWPRETWLADVDEGFYVVCYLRAWALQTHWQRALRERYGERWFQSAAAGEWLRSLWAQGQRLSAEELLAETLGEELDFAALAAELTR
jgi:hypothetical protein